MQWRQILAQPSSLEADYSPFKTVSYEAENAQPAACNESAEGCCESGCGCSDCSCFCLPAVGIPNISLPSLRLPCCTGTPWELREPCALKCRGIEWGGWVSAGFYNNAWGRTKDPGNGPLTMRSYADGMTLDQMWLYAEKVADNGGYGIDWGGHVDFIWGADGPDTQAFGDGGWDGDWFTSGDQNYGSAMPQLYGELAINDWNIKAGHFYTLLGYEVVPAPENFFYSHNYMMNFQPYTHMGALVSRKVLHDRVELTGGWVNGWDNGWLNPTDASMFLGSAALQLSDKTSLTYALTFGDTNQTLPNEFFVTGGQNTFLQSIVLQMEMTSRLTYVFESDFGTNNGDGSGTRSGAQRWYGIANYLFYQLNPCLSVGGRWEWFRFEAGQGQNYNSASMNISELTFGLNYKPRPNVTLRPEIRWDMSENDGVADFPFDNYTRSTQFSGGMDLIVTF